jgi:hypothetical protein
MQERVIRDLSGGDIPNDSPYDPAYVIQHLREAMNEDLEFKMLQKRGGDEDDKSHITQYIATYKNIEVKKDNTTQEIYAELPGEFISIKHNKGIHSVHKQEGVNKKVHLLPMIRVTNPGVTMNLPHANFEKKNWGYYTEGMRVIWMRDIKRDNITHVCMKLLIAAPESIGLDDPLPILPESAARIMDRVKLRVQNKFTQDRLLDNNPNLRAQNQ